jgi:amidase
MKRRLVFEQTSTHATAVRRLLNTGAILLGATNVPIYLMDGQAFNDIYGTSNNAWDLTHTPGGSSGGSAPSLAAGITFLSIGSDIGGRQYSITGVLLWHL